MVYNIFCTCNHLHNRQFFQKRRPFFLFIYYFFIPYTHPTEFIILTGEKELTREPTEPPPLRVLERVGCPGA